MPAKGRQPDKPGTYRIRPSKHGTGVRLSGLTLNGRRIRMDDISDAAARSIAATLFPKPETPPMAAPQSLPSEATDDWGFPIRVSEDTISSVASTLNIPDPNKPPEVKPPVPTAEEIAKKEQRAKNAKSLMDMAGIAGSFGIVLVSKRITEAADKEPVNPDPKQVKDLRESIRETLTDLFGESEIAPWQMMILLALGIPISMLLQSPRKKRIAGTEPGPNLKSVP